MLSEPLSYSTFTGADKQDTGYATGTKYRCVFWRKIRMDMESWNRTRKETTQANRKGWAFRLVERTKVRKRLEGEVESLIANIGTLMGLDKNLVLVN